jgi:hypothetical protein
MNAAEKREFIEAKKAEIDAMYAKLGEHLAFTMFGDCEPETAFVVTRRMRIRWAWNDLCLRMANAIVWFARKIHAGAGREDDE